MNNLEQDAEQAMGGGMGGGNSGGGNMGGGNMGGGNMGGGSSGGSGIDKEVNSGKFLFPFRS